MWFYSKKLPNEPKKSAFREPTVGVFSWDPLCTRLTLLQMCQNMPVKFRRIFQVGQVRRLRYLLETGIFNVSFKVLSVADGRELVICPYQNQGGDVNQG